MKAKIVSAVCCLGLLTTASHAQSIYKCTVNGAATYQQTPCATTSAPVSRAGSTQLKTPLLGTWRSDRALTMTYLRQHTNLAKKQDSFIEQLTGNMSIAFTRDRVTTVMPDLDVQVAGKPLHMTGFRNNSPYMVVSANSKLVSVSSTNPANGQPDITHYNFEDPDTMWVLMDADHKTALDPRSREYFRRVK